MNLAPAKPALLWLLFLWQAPRPETVPVSHFRYERPVQFTLPPHAGQACAVLGADVFAHAAASLKDLRMYSGQAELPYATTLSEPLQQDSDDARILNLRSEGGHILFDLEMPQRPYTGIVLDLAARDYVAKATVSGGASRNGKDATALGTFTLFDLTEQRLSHSTTIPLSESTFPYLYLDLVFAPAPGGAGPASSLSIPAIVKTATIPPSREAQSVYTTIQAAAVQQRADESVATFKVQSRVPIERVAFILPPGSRESFSRSVEIKAHGMAAKSFNSQEESGGEGSSAALGVEKVSGIILRVHKSEAGRELSAENLGVPVAIGSNMQQDALIEVKIENGAAAPLPLTVELQMRQRRICFDSRAAGPLTLYYGDPSLDAPVYKDAALRQAAANPGIAELGLEKENPAFTAPPSPRKFAHGRPILRWIALLGCVCIFALLVFRSSHRKR